MDVLRSLGSAGLARSPTSLVGQVGSRFRENSIENAD